MHDATVFKDSSIYKNAQIIIPQVNVKFFDLSLIVFLCNINIYNILNYEFQAFENINGMDIPYMI